jgi:hypothetical protein
MSGPGCTIWVLGAHDRTKLFFAPWDNGRALSWRAPVGTNGLLGNAGPNADLAADGRLMLR